MSRLAEQRRALVEQSAAQRAAILAAAAPLLRNAAVADRLLGRVRRHPIVFAAIGAAFVLLGPQRIFDVAARVLTVFTLLRR